tara:strand:- start:233 stop:1294 length:1062 start_codon:yes stop_codon:yes gene_type:complete
MDWDIQWTHLGVSNGRDGVDDALVAHFVAPGFILFDIGGQEVALDVSMAKIALNDARCYLCNSNIIARCCRCCFCEVNAVRHKSKGAREDSLARNWKVNDDGTLSPSAAPHLVLGHTKTRWNSMEEDAPVDKELNARSLSMVWTVPPTMSRPDATPVARVPLPTTSESGVEMAIVHPIGASLAVSSELEAQRVAYANALEAARRESTARLEALAAAHRATAAEHAYAIDSTSRAASSELEAQRVAHANALEALEAAHRATAAEHTYGFVDDVTIAMAVPVSPAVTVVEATLVGDDIEGGGGGGGGDVTARLTELARLYEAGHLTEAEFTAAKASVLPQSGGMQKRYSGVSTVV